MSNVKDIRCPRCRFNNIVPLDYDYDEFDDYPLYIDNIDSLKYMCNTCGRIFEEPCDL